MSEELTPFEQLGNLRYENAKKEKELMQKFAMDETVGEALKSHGNLIDYLKLKEININDNSPFEIISKDVLGKIPTQAQSKTELYSQLRKSGLKEDSPLFNEIYNTHSKDLKIR